MKVAIVTTRHGAQDDRIYYKQALSLVKRMDVILIAPDDGDALTWHPGIVYRPIPRRRSLFGRLWSVVEAVGAIRREKPDFCHLHDLDLILAIPPIRLLTRAKIIYDSHEAFPEQIGINKKIPRLLRPLAAWIVDNCEKTFVRMAHHTVTADDPTSHSFSKRNLRATTVFNFRALSVFQTVDSDLKKARAKYMARSVLLYHGTMSLDRGLLHMIDALAIIKQDEPGVLLRLVGEMNDNLRRKVLVKARNLEVEDHLEIAGWISYDAIACVVKTADIGIVPLEPNKKFNRNIPIKIFEYMACGLPMVAANLLPIKKFLDQTECGLLYDSTKPEELARCVLALLADPSRCQRMGENGLLAVQERWNWRKMEEVLFDVYESLGAKSSRGQR